jgi:hypothetical protein
MQYGALLKIMEARARRMGIGLDALDLLTAVYESLLDISSQRDFDAMTVNQQLIAQTITGIRDYPVPADFGRFPHTGRLPHLSGRGRSSWDDDYGETGLRLWNGTSESILAYRKPDAFWSALTEDPGPPTTFTRMERTLYLDPAPDENSGTNYHLRATYIVQPGYPDLEDEVPFDAPMALMLDGLNRCGATGLAFLQEHQRAMSALVNNQARIRQHFGGTAPERLTP